MTVVPAGWPASSCAGRVAWIATGVRGSVGTAAPSPADERTGAVRPTVARAGAADTADGAGEPSAAGVTRFAGTTPGLATDAVGSGAAALMASGALAAGVDSASRAPPSSARSGPLLGAACGDACVGADGGGAVEAGPGPEARCANGAGLATRAACASRAAGGETVAGGDVAVSATEGCATAGAHPGLASDGAGVAAATGGRPAEPSCRTDGEAATASEASERGAAGCGGGGGPTGCCGGGGAGGRDPATASADREDVAPACVTAGGEDAAAGNVASQPPVAIAQAGAGGAGTPGETAAGGA